MAAVLDASVVLTALIDGSPIGSWCDSWLTQPELVAPHHLPAEVTNVLRRGVTAGALSADVASMALADLTRLPLQLLPFAPLADRVWELRANVTTYDAWYVALAEALDAPLVTLDERLARASGPRCAFRTPDRTSLVDPSRGQEGSTA